MTAYQRLRMAHGLRWQSKYPSVPWQYIGYLLMIVVLIALAGSLDYQIAKAAEMEELAKTNEGLAQATLHCMNVAEAKETGYFYWKDAGLAFECGAKLSGGKI